MSLIDSAKWDFPLRIEQHGIMNGLLRLKLDDIMLPLRAALFKLQYKKIINNAQLQPELELELESEWISFLFDYEYVCKYPYDHINVRLDTDLYDYNIHMRITSTDDTLKKNKKNMKWFTWSNTLHVNIPSSMKEQSFHVNDWIKFKRPSNFKNAWTYGTVLQIVTNDTEIIYKILHYRSQKIYEIINPEFKKNIKYLTAHYYIDLTDQTDMENMLLIGDRMHAKNEYVSDIYCLLNNIFYDKYVSIIKEAIDTTDLEIDYISMSKCVALNVINCLWVKHKGYKMKCLLSKTDSDHFNDQIKLIPQREYAVGRSIDQKRYSSAQGTIYYCDICLCRQGDYYYMFRCQIEDGKKYHGHDMCLNCVYDTIKRYDKLVVLLSDLLMDDLTIDCIQTIVVYAAGNVVKL